MPMESRSLDDYGPPTTGPEAYEPKTIERQAPKPLVERQIDALCNKLLSLGVSREEIAAIMTATAEPYVGPDSP